MKLDPLLTVVLCCMLVCATVLCVLKVAPADSFISLAIPLITWLAHSPLKLPEEPKP